MATEKVKGNVYVASSGAPYPVDRAQEVGEFLEAVADISGETDFRLVTPDAVIEAARAEGTPLHDVFEWDDEKAGPQWRRHQARQTLNHTRVKRIREGREVMVPAFFNVRARNDDGESVRGYAPSGAVDASEELKKQVAAKLIREIENWQRRYTDFADCFNVALEKLRQRA